MGAGPSAISLVKYLQAYIEGWRWCFDPKNKDEAIALLMRAAEIAGGHRRRRLTSGHQSGTISTSDGTIDMEGVKNVLKLRAEFEGGTPAAPEKYLDLSYYQKALAGL